MMNEGERNNKTKTKNTFMYIQEPKGLKTDPLHYRQNENQLKKFS